MSAKNLYDGAALNTLLTAKGWTNVATAGACKVSQEHISDIIAGKTKSCRRDTYVKMVTGLRALGATEAEAKGIFRP